ncbi:MAG: DHH family phosphoesterase [Coprobacillus sp.]|nr:DHH family phosphoesterase [Coprobacillus sp.]
MNKTVRRFQLVIFIVVIAEVILITIFSALYLTDTLGPRENIDPIWITIGAVVILVADFILILVAITRVGKLRSSTDLRAAEVIGSDIQEAYNFAMVGLVVTDNNNMVLWTNDLFKDRHINIIDTNIFSWQPELIALKDENNRDSSVTIEAHDRFYQVKFLPQAGLWIFRDVTDYETINIDYKDNAVVVGILVLDNYQDLVKGEEDTNDMVTRVKSAIFRYAHDHHVLLRRYKDDTYYLLCNFKSLTEMQEGSFSILDTVRSLGSDADTRLTISVGLAYDFPDVIKLNDLANEALEIAMSRGGDQVVVYAYGKEMQFIGGKSEAPENRNRVRVRVLADSLFNVIKSSEKVFIMGHKDLDLDALGAALGIKAICSHLGKYSRIIMDLRQVEQKTRSVLTSSFTKAQLNEIVISPKEALDELTADTLLVVVDVHTQGLCMEPQLVDEANKIVVIDHHRRAEDYIENPVFNEIDSSASSSSEIVAELIRYSTASPKVALPSIYATIMLAGIFLDTRHFTAKKTGMRTFEACSILKDYGADNAQADDFLKDDYEEYKMISLLLSSLKTIVPGIVYATGDENTIFDNATLAKAADQALAVRGNHAVFVIGKTSPTGVRISCRSDSTVNVQLVAEHLGGGGHFSSAAATFENLTLAEVANRVISTIESHINEITVNSRNRSKFAQAQEEEE